MHMHNDMEHSPLPKIIIIIIIGGRAVSLGFMQKRKVGHPIMKCRKG